MTNNTFKSAVTPGQLRDASRLLKIEIESAAAQFTKYENSDKKENRIYAKPNYIRFKTPNATDTKSNMQEYSELGFKIVNALSHMGNKGAYKSYSTLTEYPSMAQLEINMPDDKIEFERLFHEIFETKDEYCNNALACLYDLEKDENRHNGKHER